MRQLYNRYFASSIIGGWVGGWTVALLSSLSLYLSWLGWSHPLPNTLFAILALYLLLRGDKTSWFWAGFGIGVLWFWWISLSFRLYGFAWATPIGIILTALTYALLFWSVAYIAEKIESKFHLSSLWIKALFLLNASLIHPFGFDWFKVELMFVESYLGVEVWQLALILLAILLTIESQRLWYLLIIILAYQPNTLNSPPDNSHIELVTTHIPVESKFDPNMLAGFLQIIEGYIERAIEKKSELIIFPESILPIFLNRESQLLTHYRERSKSITLIIGALHWDEGVPRNSSYIFKDGKLQIADKVILVPFGESNPLPDWLSDIVNKIFYDGAVDYKASNHITDYEIDGVRYRNAICYEACSAKLYSGQPKNMIVLSNNGWFTPSIEPTQQRLLLQYYSKKYGTTIYHSINMSPSYIIAGGRVIWKEKAQ